MRIYCSTCVVILFAAVAFAGDFEDGVAAQKKGDYDGAITSFTAYLKGSPKGIQASLAYVFRGQCYSAKKDYDKAIADYSDAIRIEPNNSIALAYRGNIYMVQKKDFEKAIADYTEVARLEPRNYSAFGARAFCYESLKKHDNAIADYTEAIRLFPKYTGAFRGRGDIYKGKKEYDKAVADYSEAIRLDPKHPKQAGAYDGRGSIYVLRKEYEKAAADFAEAVQVEPKHAPAHKRLALLLASCPKDSVRDGKKAVEHATKACDLNRYKSAADLDVLAAAQAETGNFKEAVNWEKKALELDKKLKGGTQRLKLYEDGKPYRQK